MKSLSIATLFATTAIVAIAATSPISPSSDLTIHANLGRHFNYSQHRSLRRKRCKVPKGGKSQHPSDDDDDPSSDPSSGKKKPKPKGDGDDDPSSDPSSGKKSKPKDDDDDDDDDDDPSTNGGASWTGSCTNYGGPDDDAAQLANPYCFDGWNPDASTALLLAYTTNGDNPFKCGQFVKVSYNGKSVVCRVADECTSCGDNGMDLTIEAFKKLANPTVGVLKNVKIETCDPPSNHGDEDVYGPSAVHL